MKHSSNEKLPGARSLCLGLLTAGALAACATPVEGPSQVATAPAPEAIKPESVSVFGIFRNGRMSPEAWEEFGKVLSAPFSQIACEAAYNNDLVAVNPELMSVIDDYTKENGVSDELLDKFSAFAKGDTILVIAINGQLPKPAADTSAENPSKPAQGPSSSGQGNYGGSGPPPGQGGGRGMGRSGGGMGRGGMGGRRGQSAPTQHAKPDKGFWELTAYFYSVRLRRSTRQVDLTQQGQDLDGDLKLFAAKVGTEIPGVPCHGWDPVVKIDTDSIRALPGQ